MSEPHDAATPWWGSLPDGAAIELALARIDLVGPAFPWTELPDAAYLQRRARYTAGVEYLARALGAVQPLAWSEDGTTLVLGGASGQALATLAFRAVKELWERVHIDLQLPARLAAHVVRSPWRHGIGDDAEPLLRRWMAGIPAGAAVLSEDLALALQPRDARELAPCSIVLEGAPSYVFPRDAARSVPPVTQHERAWTALRGYAQSPELRRIRYVGFRLRRNEPPSLDLRDVFVPPRLEVRVPQPSVPERSGLGSEGGSSEQPGARKRAAQRVVGESFAELFARHRHLVLLGDPGSGKTTLLRWLATMAASGRFVLASETGAAERLLPLPVSVGQLAELRLCSERRERSVVDALGRYFQERGAGDGAMTRETLVRELDAGRCLVLLDGLDEVRSSEREELQRWLTSFGSAHPRNRFVISSRLVGYTGFDLPGRVEATLRPFDREQIERYVNAWHRAYVRWEEPENAAASTGEADPMARKLLAAIDASPRLSALAGNPFLLSALALIHRAEGRLPRHRVQAYAMIARTLCETWAAARRLVVSDASDATMAYEEEALPILGKLALAMHERYPAGVAPEAFVVEALSAALAAQAGTSGEEGLLAARRFLEKSGRELGLLMERGAGAWGFMHLTFQEFFAAAGLHAMERFEEVALTRLFDPRWGEVIRLGVGYMALEQKRPAAARGVVERVLSWEEPEPRRWVTSVLRKQVPIAALLAAEAGEALPVALQERVAAEMAAWAVEPPSLDAPREFLSELAVTELGGRVAEALLRWLDDESPARRAMAAQALGALRSSAAVERLVSLLADADAAVRDRAGLALLRLGGDGVEQQLEALVESGPPEVKKSAIEVLISVSDDPARWVEWTRETQDGSIYEAAFKAFVECCLTFGRSFPDDPLSGAEVKLLFEAAEEGSPPGIRPLAVFLMYGANLSSPELHALLLRCVDRDPDPEVRAEAAIGLLGRSPQAVDVETVLRILSADGLDGDTGFYLAEALAKATGGEALEQDMRAALSSRDPRRRAAAVLVLSAMKTASSLAAVIAAASDPSADVRVTVIHALFHAAWSADLEQVLLLLLGDGDADVRRAAAFHLDLRRAASTVDALVSALSDSDAGVRQAVVSALSAFDDERALSTIVATLREDEDADVRRAAASALGRWHSEVAVSHLVAALTDPDPGVIEAAIEALGQIGSETAIGILAARAPHVPQAREALWKLAAADAADSVPQGSDEPPGTPSASP
ncbi:HEAT repeat domain-containing protein [Sorangium sp. So ce1000]|uniref:HEAT repeat domain-containing protein n=1 Tax=Sorangium sp. So ce1000 TaxID=3133325 RepID=UPI003F6157B9